MATTTPPTYEEIAESLDNAARYIAKLFDPYVAPELAREHVQTGLLLLGQLHGSLGVEAEYER